nr:MAG TPA: hypothetical protein [Caudoviricetes sp.]
MTPAKTGGMIVMTETTHHPLSRTSDNDRGKSCRGS